MAGPKPRCWRRLKFDPVGQSSIGADNVTFETLSRDDFLESVKAAFPRVDWDKAYNEFRAAGESAQDSAPRLE